jgi:hypothetical protein
LPERAGRSRQPVLNHRPIPEDARDCDASALDDGRKRIAARSIVGAQTTYSSLKSDLLEVDNQEITWMSVRAHPLLNFNKMCDTGVTRRMNLSGGFRPLKRHGPAFNSLIIGATRWT